MNAKDVLIHNMKMADRVTSSYLGDLTDEELLLRPVPGQNHIAWQLGHLLSSERHFVELVKRGSCPALPAGFDEAHNKEASKSESSAGFLSKDQYIALQKAQRDASLAVL